MAGKTKFVGQSKKDSRLESIVNIGSGMAIAFMIMQFILIPMLGIESMTVWKNVVVTGVLTVVSMLRSYICRRFFDWWANLKAQGNKLWDVVKLKLRGNNI